jgi:hypothetical protein
MSRRWQGITYKKKARERLLEVKLFAFFEFRVRKHSQFPQKSFPAMKNRQRKEI